MKFKLLLHLLFCSGICLAQNDLPPVYGIKSDTTVPKIPDVFWQMLVDTSGKLRIDEVSSPQFGHLFHSNNTAASGINFSGLHHYWQRIRMKNESGKPIRIVFHNRPWADRFELYAFRSDGRTENQVSGRSVPYSQRDGYRVSNALPLTFEAGEEIIIYRKLFIKQAPSGRGLDLGFTFLEDYIRPYLNPPWYIGDLRNWFIAGLLIFGFFFNFFFFLIDKEKVYLYMALLLLVEGIWYLSTNYGITFRESPRFKVFFDVLITHSLFFFLVVQFVRQFLKTWKYYPKWDRILIALTILMIATAIARTFYFSELFDRDDRMAAEIVTSLIFAVLMISLLLSFLFFRKEGGWLPNLSVVAVCPLLLLWGFGYFISRTYELSNAYYGTPEPPFMIWYTRNEMIIEMFCMAWFALLFTWILLQRYSMLRKQYAQQALEREREKIELINQQKTLLEVQVEERTAELRHSIQELKSTQTQLIHSEKMASLGELTAGIAHEIQNPLNFVNNFSEVNKELTGELDEALSQGNWEEARQIAKNISENQEKITHHGQRADSIVKGMLQHSRSSSGIKEPTDINALADEYLRLAYHGLRAKDKSFNAAMKTDLDTSISPVNVIMQDIGRVILNLITNAFYAVAEKQKTAVKGYEPLVTVSTRNTSGSVEIRVTDNGNGIPQQVRDKIFQPFFTTKPAGEGTGLGLSLSYDIVKAHGGELTVKTEEGKGTEFIIQLPLEK